MRERLWQNKLTMCCLVFMGIIGLLGIFAPWIAFHDPLEANLMENFLGPSFKYPLGTDHLGRCVFSRLIYGIRSTVFLAILSMIGTMMIGVLIGLIAGYCHGWIDEIIMRLIDIFLSFPSQVMVLALISVLGQDIKYIIMASILAKWPWYARVIRSTVLQYTNSQYVNFAKCIGHKPMYIFTHHLIPSMASELVVLASLDTGWAILNISTLSFLGLGVKSPTPEWGAMLSDAKHVMMNHPEQMIAPGLAIVLVVAVLNFLGDGLRDVLDPREANQ